MTSWEGPPLLGPNHDSEWFLGLSFTLPCVLTLIHVHMCTHIHTHILDLSPHP